MYCAQVKAAVKSGRFPLLEKGQEKRRKKGKQTWTVVNIIYFLCILGCGHVVVL